MIERFKAQVFLQSLRDAERLTSERRVIFTRMLLQRLVEHCSGDAFWRQRMAALWRSGSLDLDAWADVPLLAAEDAMRLPLPVLPRAPEDTADTLDIGERGGAFRHRDNLSRVADQGVFERICEIYRVPLDATMMDVAALPTLEHPDWGWNSTFDKAKRLHFPKGWPPEFHVEKLLTTGAKLLRGEPATLGEIAGILSNVATKPKLAGVIAIGEPADDVLYQDIAKRFEAPVIRAWHDDRFGIIAFRGPGDDAWRIPAATHHIEVVRDDGQPCSLNERGRVAVTQLYSYASPAIRVLSDASTMPLVSPAGHRTLGTLRPSNS